MAGSGRQYAVLVLLFAAGSWEAVRLVRVGEVPSAPFAIRSATRTIGDGPLRGDEILSLNGRPLVGVVQYDDAVRRARPGDKLQFVLSEPSGRAVEKMVAIPGASRIVTLNVFVPLLCLAAGFGVVLNRRRDTNAWMLWLALIGFAGLAAIALLIFSIYFPARLAQDRRRPWLKYIFLIPAVATEAALRTIHIIWQHDIAASQVFASTYITLSHIRIAIDLLSILGFFVVLGLQAKAEQSPDNFRRLRILRTGSFLALTPMLPVIFYAGIPAPLQVFAFCAMALFPMTLIYVVVAERAMGLSVIVRSAVPSVWLNKKFFPEAYNAEVMLRELALETDRYMDLKTIAHSVDDALHVEDIVILVREGNICRTRYSTRHGEPMDIPLNSHILPGPKARLEPRQVFPDRPQPWMRSLDTTELQTLAYMRSEVLLVIPGQGSQIAGAMSLGAKNSGEAYSPTDLRLLQTIATRMGTVIDHLTA